MINIYPADYEKLRHNWVHVYSNSINAKFLRLDNLPTLNISSTWSNGAESKLGNLASAVETAKDFVDAFVETKSFNQGFVKATPSAWGGGSVLTFSINTLITNFDATKRFPKLSMMGKSQSVDKLSGSMADVNTLLKMVSPSAVSDYRYHVFPDFSQYAKYIPIKLKESIQSAAGKDSSGEKLEWSDFNLSNIMKVIQGVEIGDGSNVAAANAGTDKNLIALTFAQNTKEVYHFGHHFVPTKVAIDPAPIMIAYIDDSNQKRLTLPYLKASLEFQAVCVLSANKVIESMVVD